MVYDTYVFMAQVEVNIKQMPGLKKIIYYSEEQAGENGAFNGSAYYRFGDVVSKTNADGETEYWICVRPAFGPEKREESHWISVSDLPKANIYSKTGEPIPGSPARNATDWSLPSCSAGTRTWWTSTTPTTGRCTTSRSSSAASWV